MPYVLYIYERNRKTYEAKFRSLLAFDKKNLHEFKKIIIIVITNQSWGEKKGQQLLLLIIFILVPIQFISMGFSIYSPASNPNKVCFI